MDGESISSHTGEEEEETRSCVLLKEFMPDRRWVNFPGLSYLSGIRGEAAVLKDRQTGRQTCRETKRQTDNWVQGEKNEQADR